MRKLFIDNFVVSNLAIEFSNYSVEWTTPATMTLMDGSTLYSSPPPGSGSITLAIVHLMDELRARIGKNATLPDEPKTYQLLAEAMKFSYARRHPIGDSMTEEERKNLTNEEFIKDTLSKISDSQTSQDEKFYGLDLNSTSPAEEHGTTHISVLDEDGNAVSVTSTINLYFGSS